ncbi:unnamed protein product [Sympodiomycopsis kandeliae]
MEPPRSHQDRTIPSHQGTLLLACKRTWVQRWCIISQSQLEVYDDSHNRISSYSLGSYDSLQTSGSWGANAGPFELILSRKPSNQQHSSIPRANTCAALNTLYKSSSLTEEGSTTQAPSPVSRAMYLLGGSTSRNGSTTSLASTHSVIPRRTERNISSAQKTSAWSRWTGKRLARLSNTGSDRTLSDSYSRMNMNQDNGASSATSSDVLVLRAPSGSSMTAWAEAISPLLRQPESTKSTSKPEMQNYATERIRSISRLQPVMRPSIASTIDDLNTHTELSSAVDRSSHSPDTSITESITPYPNPYSHIFMTSLLEEAGHNARRRRAESTGENSANRNDDRPRLRRVPPSAMSGYTKVSETNGIMTAKKRLSRISFETSRRLSLRGDSSSNGHHSRPTSSAGGGCRRSSSGLSQYHQQVNGTASVRNSAHSERRASSPMALFSLFSQSKLMTAAAADESHSRDTSEESEIKERRSILTCMPDLLHGSSSSTGHGQEPHPSIAPDMDHSQGSALGLVFGPASDLHPLPSTVSTLSRSDVNDGADHIERQNTSPSPFTVDYSPSLAPTSPRTPATINTPLAPHRKISPWSDARELAPLDDQSYEIIPSLPNSISMPVIAPKQEDHCLKRSGRISQQVAILGKKVGAPLLQPLNGEKMPTRRKWTKAAAGGKPTTKGKHDGSVEKESLSSLARRFEGMTTSFSSRALSTAHEVDTHDAIPEDQQEGSTPEPESSPTLTIERILPPEVMISRLDEIRKMEPAAASVARKDLMSTRSCRDGQDWQSGALRTRRVLKRPNTSAGTVSTDENTPLALTSDGLRPLSPSALSITSDCPSTKRSPRTGLPPSSCSSTFLSTPLHGNSLPAPPRLPKKRSAGPFSSSSSHNASLPRCQSSMALSSINASPIQNINTAFPSPEKTSSTFNSRSGKWKRHSTFSILEGKSQHQDAEEKENLRDIFNSPSRRPSTDSLTEDKFASASGNTSFSFSAYNRPSMSNSAAEGEDESILSSCPSFASSSAADVNQARILKVTKKWNYAQV